MTFVPDSTDADLVAAVAAGSELALGALYDRHAEAVYAQARRLLADPQAAEEIVQETFLALWNRAETFDPALGSAVGWLRSIGRHRVVDRLRSKARGPRVTAFADLAVEDEENGYGLEQVLAGARPAMGDQAIETPEAALLAGEVHDLVRAALEAMPEYERTVIELAYRDELTQAEIASRLGWPLGTVKTRTRRALRMLRVALGEQLGLEVPAAVRGADDGPR